MNNNTNDFTKSDTETTETIKEKKMKKKRIIKKVLLIALSVFLIIIVAFVGVALYTYLFHEPDNGANEPPPFATGGLLDSTQDTPSITLPPETDDITGETLPPQTVDPNSLPKSEQKIYNFLFVGQDRIALNTDVIMLINFNTTTNDIRILQIPRDTYIEADNYAGKINGMYAYYYLNQGCNTKIALRKFADTLEKNLCLKIHNVGHINLDGVVAMVDAVGGVDVNLPAAVTYYDGGVTKTIPAGKQHLNGIKAEAFVRHRATYLQADIGRIDAQKLFVSAFIQRIKSNFNVSTISKFVDIAFKYVTTDVSLADAVFYAKQLLDVNMNDIKLMSMIGGGAMGDGLSYYVMVRKNMREMINLYFNIYDFEITDSIFDPNKAFTSKYRYQNFNNIYNNTSISTTDPYNAGDLNEDSINIPHF